MTFIMKMLTNIFCAWVLTILWRWFLIPIFPDLDPISIAQGFGLFIVVSVFRGCTTHDAEVILNPNVSATEISVLTAIGDLVVAAFALGIGWVVLQFT